jgi:hypothetical protein
MILLLVALGLTKVQSQNNMTLRFTGGVEKMIALNQLVKITFLTNTMVMSFTNGTFEAVDLLSIQKIGFTVVNGLQEGNLKTKELGVYPSPASTTLSLINLPDGAKFAILFRLDGTVISKIQLSSTSQDIDVSYLSSGFYLLRVNNSTVKFAKK